MKKGKRLRAFKRYLPLYLLALPSMLYLLINNYIPMAGIVIAFKNINLKDGIFNSPWCGFQNFKYLFATKDAFTITRNTILYNIAFIILGTAFAILLAILLSKLKNRVCSKFYQTVILFPYLVSMIIVSYLAYAFLSEKTGFLNNSILPLCGAGIHSWDRPGGGGEARPALHLGPLPAGTAGAGHSRSCDLRCGILHYKRTR